MALNRRYVELLRYLGGGANVYDGTLALYVKQYRITEDNKVVAIIGDTEIDLLPLYTTVKLVNKLVEFILKDAALSLGGVWNADDDGVLNMRSISVVPGSVIPKAVGSAGLQALDSGRKFNINWAMVESVREQIRNYFYPNCNQCDW